MSQYYAVIEAGGTKFNCAMFDAQHNILSQNRIPTTTPAETLDACIEFFLAQKQAGLMFSQLGLACFGPLVLNQNSNKYGYITKTPKPGWSDTPILARLKNALECDVAIDTDVNAAALAESRWGAAKNTQVSVYVTLGTGVGVGVVINGNTLKGLIHPEAGHMLIPAPEGIEGQCPFHGNCVEGLASGKALSKIWGRPAETLEDDHRAWDIQAQVVAKLCHNLLVSYSPQSIVLGGGVMAKPGLLDNVIGYTETSLQGYLDFPDGVSLSSLITLPGLGEMSGLKGALGLIL